MTPQLTGLKHHWLLHSVWRSGIQAQRGLPQSHSDTTVKLPLGTGQASFQGLTGADSVSKLTGSSRFAWPRAPVLFWPLAGSDPHFLATRVPA